MTPGVRNNDGNAGAACGTAGSSSAGTQAAGAAVPLAAILAVPLAVPLAVLLGVSLRYMHFISCSLNIRSSPKFTANPHLLATNYANDEVLQP